MAAMQIKKRWECPVCGMENRAYRDACFGTDCKFLREEITEAEYENDANAVEFKDENSKVIARFPSRLASALRSELVYMVQNLMRPKVSGEASKHENLLKANELQKRMRNGVQVVADFDGAGALWGYTRRKFFSRAITSFELFRNAREALGEDVFHEKATVLSIGGGPGNDLFGYLLFEKYGKLLHGTRTSKMDTACDEQKPQHSRQLGVFDFAPGWRPIVENVGRLSGHDIIFQTCDLTVPLESTTNDGVSSALVAAEEHDSLSPPVIIYLFSYVLSEVMGPAGDPPSLLESLFAHAVCRTYTSVFLFREPRCQTLPLQKLIERHPEWRENTDFWHLPCGGLMVVFQ